MPLFSIVLPVYNVEEYIVESIKSIENQSFDDYEVILVNDGSLDNSITLAEDYLSTTKINYRIIHQCNKGVAEARNIGIKYSSGEWIICMDPDDAIRSDTLSKVASIINNYDEIVAIGYAYKLVSNIPMTICKNNTQDVVRILSKNEISKQFLFRKTKIISPGIAIRRSFIYDNKLFYNPDVKFSEDQLYIWNLLSHVTLFAFLDEKLYYYRARPGSTMRISKKVQILTGYKEFFELNRLICNGAIDCGYYGEYIFSRWVLGTLHSSAKHMKYNDLSDLACEMSYKQAFRKLKRIPDIKSCVLACLGLVSFRVFYIVGSKL